MSAYDKVNFCMHMVLCLVQSAFDNLLLLSHFFDPKGGLINPAMHAKVTCTGAKLFGDSKLAQQAYCIQVASEVVGGQDRAAAHQPALDTVSGPEALVGPVLCPEATLPAFSLPLPTLSSFDSSASELVR